VAEATLLRTFLWLDPHMVVVALHATAIGMSFAMTGGTIRFRRRMKITAQLGRDHRVVTIKCSDQGLRIIHTMTVFTVLKLRLNQMRSVSEFGKTRFGPIAMP